VWFVGRYKNSYILTSFVVSGSERNIIIGAHLTELFQKDSRPVFYTLQCTGHTHIYWQWNFLLEEELLLLPYSPFYAFPPDPLLIGGYLFADN